MHGCVAIPRMRHSATIVSNARRRRALQVVNEFSTECVGMFFHQNVSTKFILDSATQHGRIRPHTAAIPGLHVWHQQLRRILGNRTQLSAQCCSVLLSAAQCGQTQSLGSVGLCRFDDFVIGTCCHKFRQSLVALIFVTESQAEICHSDKADSDLS